jgi:hypothetical protein
MVARADQLLEAARLGSDKVEYLTHGQKISTADCCKVAGKHVDDLPWRRMVAFGLDQYEKPFKAGGAQIPIPLYSLTRRSGQT